MKRKYKKLLILFLFLISVYLIDFTLVSHDKKTVFVIGTSMAKDGGTRQYYGLGYKVIKWNKLSSKQIDGKEINGVLIGYELSIFPSFQDINDGPKKELEFIAEN